MGWKRVTARSGKASAGYLLAGGLTGALLLWLAYSFVLTFPVTIDGRPQRLVVGTLVSDLFERKAVTGKPGDLVAAKDRRVLRPGKGEKPYVTVDGKPVPRDAQLGRGDVIRSMDGTDVVEPLVKRTEPIAVPTQYRGSGSVQSVIATGKAGVRELTVGSLSKQVVSTRIVTAAQPRIVQRSVPDGRAKIVALTFDDGPWPGQTEAVLKILQRYGIKATFFQIGAQVRGRPQVSRMLADAGMQLANHTQTHQNLKKLSAEAVGRQIRQCQDSIEKASGQRPKYFRPPGGNVASPMWPVLEAEGMRNVQWDIDTNDWRKPGVGAIADRVVNNIRPGAVVLMHDGGGDRSQTIKALPSIIERLRAMGYSFVTLDALPELPARLG